ncbi:GAF domain-containing protein [Mycolicibacterium stellerae]|uniref:GAF domain-containing protein n=1 Tax=Mycolicibacterium stellerae TaxID=2358193 RepID=UPI000F0AFA2F|nr:GAF domain-containing protein [Mycolicibacterium stellerae]
MPNVPSTYRAPMRSRRDDVDFGATIERALRVGVCGFGEPVHDGRSARRVERFADVEQGSFVWTRDPDGLYWLGRVSGPYFYDDTDDAVAVDLVHVRECDWLPKPLLEPEVPAAVVATFRRGGRNFQQTHDATAGAASLRIWEALSPPGIPRP